MNLTIYQKETTRTLAPLSSKLHNSIHMSLGMSSELGELIEALTFKASDIPNIIEELGDMLWFMASYANIYNYDLDKLSMIPKFGKYETKEVLDLLTIKLGKLQTIDKNELAYNRERDLVKQEALFYEVLMLFYNLCSSLTKYLLLNKDLVVEEIAEININKLKARFPDKFSIEKANNRNLDMERKVLENK